MIARSNRRSITSKVSDFSEPGSASAQEDTVQLERRDLDLTLREEDRRLQEREDLPGRRRHRPRRLFLRGIAELVVELERPLLEAVRAGDQCVLLIDEIDRADDEFEAFLLELLSDFQITIPEIGSITAPSRPLVILTSNRTRELHDALKRRCLYHWIDYPSVEQEVAIIALRAPDVPEVLAHKVVAAVNRLRGMELAKPPGVAETLDWAAALGVIGSENLDVDSARDTLGSVVKDRDDLIEVSADLGALVVDG